MKLYFYTTNGFKFRFAQKVLRSYGIELERMEPEFREIQSEKPQDKVLHSLRRANLIPAMAEDSGLFIEKLRGFPGTITGYVQRVLTPVQFSRLIGEKSRAELISVAGVKTSAGIRLFTGRVVGWVIPKPRGKSKFWIDCFFIPEGESRTIAEIGINEFLPVSDWAKSFRKVGEYLKN